MTTKSTEPLLITPTLADAFEVGKREGLKEAFGEIKQMLNGKVSEEALRIYAEARLKSILDFSSHNPFKQKE
jgi:hypothetical protein